jgi:hypothetical protein
MTSAQRLNRSLLLSGLIDGVAALSVKVGEHLKRMGVVWK